MTDDVKVGDEAQQQAREEAERIRQETLEIEQAAIAQAARKMAEKADVEPKDLINDKDLDVLKIGK
ncbi:MAG: hypothetical protein EON60_06010 [Alphaproteobacteria bacterium]|nr:MAG: hypothetical protein EON60_06010 [Alphaproteobacteria bacterium]